MSVNPFKFSSLMHSFLAFDGLHEPQSFQSTFCFVLHIILMASNKVQSQLLEIFHISSGFSLNISVTQFARRIENCCRNRITEHEKKIIRLRKNIQTDPLVLRKFSPHRKQSSAKIIIKVCDEVLNIFQPRLKREKATSKNEQKIIYSHRID